jgi:hypothetical protein
MTSLICLPQTWLPGISDSSAISDLSRFRKLLYLKIFKFPMLATREAVVLGYGDVFSHDSVMVYLSTIEATGPWNPDEEHEEALSTAPSTESETSETSETSEKLPGAAKPVETGGLGARRSASAAAAAVPAPAPSTAPTTCEGERSLASSWAAGDHKSPTYSEYTSEIDARTREKGHVRIKLSGGFLFQKISPSQTKVSTALKIDIGLPFIPHWIIDWIMKNVASMFIPMLNSQAGKFEPGGKLSHLPDEPQYQGIYAEMHRRLNAMG